MSLFTQAFKCLILICPLFAIGQSDSRLRIQAGAGVNAFLPMGELKEGMPMSLGGKLDIYHQLPVAGGRLFLGASYAGSVYGTVSKELNFVNEQGARNATQLSVQNSVDQMQAQIRYYTGKLDKIAGFVGAGIGSAVFTTHMQATREQIYHCPPADSDGERLFRDRTGLYSAELGLLLPISDKGNSFLQLQGQWNQGGTAQFLNTQGSTIQSGAPPVGQPGSEKEVRMRFLDLQTDAVHEHVIAREYSAAYRQLSISLSFVYQFKGFGYR